MKIQLRALGVIAIVLITSCVTRVIAAPPFVYQARVSYSKLALTGEAQVQGGFYDPSVAFTPDGKVGVLAYSALLGSAKWNFPIGPYIQTHVAQSTDGGQSWRYLTTVNGSLDGSVTMQKLFGSSSMDGVWRYEVPSLVYDAGDPGREWKLFYHRYFWSKSKDRMPAFGWIALKTASDPAGPWSPEIPLFGSQHLPPAPYHTAVNLNSLSPSLSDVLIYTEPGAYYRNGTIYLSLSALGMHGPEKIVLVASRDHGTTWDFRGTLVTNADAQALGYKRLDGSAIAEDRGAVYFMASPEGDKAMHEGTSVVEFKDLDHGVLARDSQGMLTPKKLIPCQAEIMSKPGCGQATYDQHDVRGLIMPQANFNDKPHIFQIWQSNVHLAD